MIEYGLNTTWSSAKISRYLFPFTVSSMKTGPRGGEKKVRTSPNNDFLLPLCFFFCHSYLFLILHLKISDVASCSCSCDSHNLHCWDLCFFCRSHCWFFAASWNKHVKIVCLYFISILTFWNRATLQSGALRALIMASYPQSCWKKKSTNEFSFNKFSVNNSNNTACTMRVDFFIFIFYIKGTKY